MNERGGKLILAVLLVCGLGVAIYLARSMPGMFGNTAYIGGLVFLQLLVVAIWNFRRWFFLFLMIGFLWAGLDVPMAGSWTSGRWALLAVGAAAGFVVYMSQPQHRYGAFHLIAAMAAVAGIVSAAASEAPGVSSMKALSLVLLFLYAACGGRAGIVGRGKEFVAGLVIACEFCAYATAIAYFVLGQETWGNPNSLGLAMALMSPVLLWATLTTQSRSVRARRMLAFTLAIALLIWSNSRASILSGVLAMAILCLCVRKNRLLIQGAAAVLCLVSISAIAAPSRLKNFMSESTDTMIYKGHREEGILGSRLSPWQDTTRSLRQHPWFGTGFGTSAVEENHSEIGVYSSTEATTREHGSSYLAILEWAGYLGVLPFAGLIAGLLWRIEQSIRWLYRTGNSAHPAVPLMLVLLAGLLHAGFEDWLFAVGYYVTVFFWTVAFGFIDLGPVPILSESAVLVRRVPVPTSPFGMATPGR